MSLRSPVKDFTPLGSLFRYSAACCGHLASSGSRASQLEERRPLGQVQGKYPVREVRGRCEGSDVPTEFYSLA